MIKNTIFWSVTAICLLVGNVCFSIDPEWNPGVVILDNNYTLEGDLSYDHKNGIIQCREAGKIKAFSSHKVTSFYYLDKGTNVLHRYIAIEQKTRENYRRKEFYEIVLEGELTLLRKRNKSTDPLRQGHTQSSYNLMHHILCYDYYVYHQEDLVAVNKFKKNVMPLMKEKKREVASYADQKNLKLYYLMDQISLLSYYNGLVYAENGRTQSSLSYHLSGKF
jgi:hypothetical protein